MGIPSGYVKIALEHGNMAIEKVSFSLKSGEFLMKLVDFNGNSHEHGAFMVISHHIE